MSLGFNSKIEAGGSLYHVQTEDRGAHHPFIDTVVIVAGRVLHRRSTSYEDLLGGGVNDPAIPAALRERVERQHREIVEAVKRGMLPLEKPANAENAGIEVKLRNPTAWLAAGHASLEIEVRARGNGQPVGGAEIEVRMEGVTAGDLTPNVPLMTQTDSNGHAELQFPLPPIAEPEAATLAVLARSNGAQDQLRFRLKTKPRRVPVQTP